MVSLDIFSSYPGFNTRVESLINSVRNLCPEDIYNLNHFLNLPVDHSGNHMRPPELPHYGSVIWEPTEMF